MALPSEYQRYLEANLNAFERLSGAFSGLDERIDYTNKLLTQLVQLQGGVPMQTPPWVANLEALTVALRSLVDRLTTVTGASPRNLEAITIGTKDVPTAGEAAQLPSFPVPYGFVLTVTAKLKNSGAIYIGSSKSGAEDPTARIQLNPGDSIDYSITNPNILWIDADSNGDGVELTSEATEAR